MRRAHFIEVLIEGLQLQCRVGVPKEERRSPQNVRIDLRIALRRAPEKDAIDATFDYHAAIRAIKAVVAEGKPCVLLETLGERIAAVLLEDRRILRMDIELRKPHKIESCEAVGVRMQIHGAQEG